jgi:4-carboxymuconolactone decarboxylase
MSSTAGTGDILSHLDDATRALVRLAAALAAGSEVQVRDLLIVAFDATPHIWIEELLLQTYLFAGFPRTLNGMREWRRLQPVDARDSRERGSFRERGEDTCRRVYGGMYERLRVNITELHPLLDAWMIEEGYGKVLSRPGLDLARRELCIVAACAASAQDRQLQSHLHGAQNVGVPPAVIGATFEALQGVIDGARLERAQRLWNRVRDDVH